MKLFQLGNFIYKYLQFLSAFDCDNTTYRFCSLQSDKINSNDVHVLSGVCLFIFEYLFQQLLKIIWKYVIKNHSLNIMRWWFWSGRNHIYHIAIRALLVWSRPGQNYLLRMLKEFCFCIIDYVLIVKLQIQRSLTSIAKLFNDKMERF